MSYLIVTSNLQFYTFLNGSLKEKACEKVNKLLFKVNESTNNTLQSNSFFLFNLKKIGGDQFFSWGH